MFEDRDVERGTLITDVSSWEGRKTEEQSQGGWAEDAVVKMREALGSADDKKGKGKAAAEPREVETLQEVVEFQPKEGAEGMEDMVNRALGKIFDVVQSVA